MTYAVDIYQNTPPDKKWTGVVTKHPDEGGPGVEVHRRTGYPSEVAAADGCDLAIKRHANGVVLGGPRTFPPSHAHDPESTA